MAINTSTVELQHVKLSHIWVLDVDQSYTNGMPT